ncbi:uncharacterized protein LOC122808572 [Protopterus annectens]|uniref:uncharacterized protein LOC122808572 n=1 Tax=Protopterus annectens TaxID=7888 RepID=UPI001CFB0D60|nr:uncharacterized protein LOC122808572 [Protopterus annectens]
MTKLFTVEVILLLQLYHGAGKTDWSIQVPDTVNVESGKSARLPCTFTHPIDDYRGNITVIWRTGNTFHGPVIFQCVLPYQESAETYTCNNVATTSDKDRYLFSGNPNNNDISIEIVNIRNNDRNEYFCRVQLEDVSHAYSSEKPINLQVNGIGRYDWSIQAPATVNAQLGMSTRLPCTFTHPVDDYKGNVTVIWRTGDPFRGPLIFQCVLPYQENAESYTCTNAVSNKRTRFRFGGNLKKNDISIEIVSTSYSDRNSYFCRVQLEDPSYAYSSGKALRLRVDGAGKADWSIQVPDTVNVESGKSARLPCTFTHPIDDYRGNITVIWRTGNTFHGPVIFRCVLPYQETAETYTCNNVATTTDKDHYIFSGNPNDNDISIEIVNIRDNDRNEYFCRVQLEDTSHAYSSQNPINLQVNGIGRYDWSIKVPAVVNVQLGKSARLPCTFTHPVDDYRGNVTVIWRTGDPFRGALIFQCVLPYQENAESYTCTNAVSNTRARFRFSGNLKKNDISIEIPSTSYSDRNSYFCRVQLEDPSYAYSSGKAIRLQVDGAGKTDWSIQVPDTVNVESGKSARLPCTFTHPIDDYQGNITVIWKTGNAFHGPVIFQCVLPYQESAETYTCNNVATKTDKDRYLFSGNPNDNDISIEIVNIRDSDRNEYFCRVQLEDPSHAYSSQNPINLQVNGAGKTDWSMQVPDTVNVESGKSARLPCTFTHPIDDYRGNITVIWKTGNAFHGPVIFQCVLPYQESAETYTCNNLATMTDKDRYLFSGNPNDNDISIEIVNIRDSDRNEYFCRVQLEDPSHAYSSQNPINLQVNGVGKADWSIHVPDTVNTESGKSAKLPCTFTHPIDDYRGDITVIWRTGNAFNGPVIFQCVLPYQKSAETYTCDNVATSTDKHHYRFSGNPNNNDISIEIINTKYGDINKYFCRVQLEDATHAYSSAKAISLQVHGPPRILSLSTKIYEDKEVAVICTVEAEPAPTITWKISSSCQPMLQSLRHNPTQHLMIGEIQNITSSANYTCISINEHGRDEKVFQYLLASSAGIPVLEKSEALKRELKPLNEAVIVLTLLCIALLILLFILGYKYRVDGSSDTTSDLSSATQDFGSQAQTLPLTCSSLQSPPFPQIKFAQEK